MGKPILRLKELISATPGMSGAKLSELVGVHAQTVTNWNAGRAFPDPDNLLKIAEALNVDLRELFIETKGANLPDSIKGKVGDHLREALDLLERQQS